MVKKLLSKLPFRIVSKKNLDELSEYVEVLEQDVDVLRARLQGLMSRSEVLDAVEAAMPRVKQMEYHRGYKKGAEIGFKKGIEHVKRHLLERVNRPV